MTWNGAVSVAVGFLGVALHLIAMEHRKDPDQEPPWFSIVTLGKLTARGQRLEKAAWTCALVSLFFLLGNF